MNTNIKPFYIYTDRNSLYIKNINESSERLASNIYIYSANIDKNNNIHILAIDNFIFEDGISTVLCFELFAFLILVNISAIGSVIFNLISLLFSTSLLS